MPRSGLALRHGITCLNTPGLIDSGYRGEVSVLLVNTDPESTYVVERGDRIAQLVIQRVEQADFAMVEELPESARGAGGFGHSGR
jgi:dUTP pyrophosphatase